jgi:hypothetical protein
MNVYSSRQDIADTFISLSKMSGDRISKSFHLSTESLPINEMLEYMSMSENETYRSAAKVLSKYYNKKNDIPDGDSVIEMCTIAPVEDVISGKVRLYIPGYPNTVPIYYDVTLYTIHLRHILYLLNTNPDYHFYPLEPKVFGEYGSDYMPINVIDGQSAIVLTDNIVVQFTQFDIIKTLYEHLFSQSAVRSKYYHSREEIINLLRQQINALQV